MYSRPELPQETLCTAVLSCLRTRYVQPSWAASGNVMYGRPELPQETLCTAVLSCLRKRYVQPSWGAWGHVMYSRPELPQETLCTAVLSCLRTRYVRPSWAAWGHNLSIRIDINKDYDDFYQGGYDLPRGVKPVHHMYKEHLLALIQTCHLFIYLKHKFHVTNV